MLIEKRKYDPSENKQHFANFFVKVHCCRLWYLSEWELTDTAFPFWRLYYNTIEGAKVLYNGVKAELNEDVIAIIPPNTSYSCTLKGIFNQEEVQEGISGGRIEGEYSKAEFKSKGIVDHLFVHFNIGYPFDFAKPGIYLIKPDRDMRDKLDALRHSCIANSFEDVNSMVKLYSLIVELLGGIPGTVWQSSNLDSRMTKIMHHIDKHLNTKLTNEGLAEYANMATNSFARLFRQSVGETIQHYITRRRLEKAQMLLHHSTHNIDSIAQECGFCDRYHFTRTFSQYLSMTPVAYRKLHTYGG